jgi:hypothetical protein
MLASIGEMTAPWTILSSSEAISSGRFGDVNTPGRLRAVAVILDALMQFREPKNPCRRFACILADTHALLGANVGR